VDLPEGTQGGTTIRLRDKGAPSVHRRGRGDQYTTLIVEIPKNLSEREKELFRELASLKGEALKRASRKAKVLAPSRMSLALTIETPPQGIVCACIPFH